MSDNLEVSLQRQITRLRNIAKTKPMTLAQKLDVLARVRQLEEQLRAHRLAKA